MWITTLWHEGAPLLQWGVVIGASLAAALTDMATRRIPNLLTLPVFVAGLVWAGIHAGRAGLGDAFLASVLLSVPYVVLFLVAGGGAGDAKLMGAVGAWLGTMNGLVALAGVAVSGIVLALIFAATRRRLRPVLTGVALFVLGVVFAVIGRKLSAASQGSAAKVSDREKMPYGIAVFVGVCLAACGVTIWRA